MSSNLVTGVDMMFVVKYTRSDSIEAVIGFSVMNNPGKCDEKDMRVEIIQWDF